MDRGHQRPSLAALLLSLIAGLFVAGCNTIEGAGSDIEAAGDYVEETADEVEDELDN